MHHRILIAATATALAVTACSSGSSNASSSGGSRAKKSTASSSSVYESPLSDAMGQVNQESYAREAAKAEKNTQACMAKEGFEYIPVNTSPDVYQEDFSNVGPQAPEWRKKYGYGMVAQVLEPEDNIYGDGGDFKEQVDPNMKLFEKLSKAEQRAYGIALDGYDSEAVAVVTQPNETSGGAPTKGCRAVAYQKLWGQTDEKTQQLQRDLYEEMISRMDADPRIKKMTKAWKSCLGGDFSSIRDPGGAYDYIQKQIDEIVQSNEGNGLSEVEGPAPTSLPPSTEEMTLPPTDFSSDQKSRLKTLQKTEIALANADYKCQEKLDLVKKGEEIRIEIEQQIVDSHGSDLRKIKAAGGGGQG